MSIRSSLSVGLLAVLASCQHANDRVESGKPASPAGVSPAPSASRQNDSVTHAPPAAAYAGFEAGGGYRVKMRHGIDPVTDSASLEIDFVRGSSPDSVIHVATIQKRADNASVLRADTSTIVLVQQSDYGFGEPEKLFLDPATKRMVKKVAFSPDAGLTLIEDTTAARALHLPAELIHGLKEREPPADPNGPWDAALPKELREHPLPQPTYSDFAKARPGRVEDGYDSANADIGESPGPVQRVGNRIWFGKRFYDGEGSTGIGGVGYFDTTTSKYTFLAVPEIVGWSVSAILVDGNDLWLGLVSHPEGADYGGGLVRHNLQTSATTRYELKDVILSIRRWNNSTYLATPRGFLVLTGDRITDGYIVEPKIDGTYELIRLPSSDLKR